MKWFKHFTDAGAGKFLNAAIDHLGIQAYAWYFLLVELCAEKYNPKTNNGSEFEFIFHERIVRQKLRISRKNLRKFLEKCSELSQKFAGNSLETFTYTWECNENEIKISMPKLLECLDRDAKKARLSALDPHEIAPKIKNEEEDEEEKTGAFNFDLIYDKYPRKEGKAAAFAVLFKTILSESDFNDLDRAVINYADDCRAEKREKKFIRMFSSFIGPAKAPNWREWVDYKPQNKPTPMFTM